MRQAGEQRSAVGDAITFEDRWVPEEANVVSNEVGHVRYIDV